MKSYKELQDIMNTPKPHCTFCNNKGRIPALFFGTNPCNQCNEREELNVWILTQEIAWNEYWTNYGDAENYIDILERNDFDELNKKWEHFIEKCEEIEEYKRSLQRAINEEEKPNATTIAALEENHSELERYSTTDDLFAALDADEATIPSKDNMFNALEANINIGWTAKNIFWLATSVICWLDEWFVRLEKKEK